MTNAVPSTAKHDSNIRRIHRFISEVRFDYNLFAVFIFKLFNFAEQAIFLSIDRTNWKWGKCNINYLVLAVVYKSSAIPVLWLVLNKKGNSNTKERIALLKRFKQIFPNQSIQGILGDREFIGDDWLKWLNEQANIPYLIRIRKNHQTTNTRLEPISVDALFRTLKVGELRQLEGKRRLGTQWVYLSALRLTNSELLIIASNIESDQAIEFYAKRWEIETLFGNLKGRGFHLEDTRVTQLRRLKILLVAPVIAYCWSHKCGEAHNEKKPIKIKKHGRLAKSLFRYGLDWMNHQLYQILTDSVTQALNKMIELLKPQSRRLEAL